MYTYELRNCYNKRNYPYLNSKVFLGRRILAKAYMCIYGTRFCTDIFLILYLIVR